MYTIIRNGDIYKIDEADFEKEVTLVNQTTHADGRRNRNALDEVPLVKATWFMDRLLVIFNSICRLLEIVLKEGVNTFEAWQSSIHFQSIPIYRRRDTFICGRR